MNGTAARPITTPATGPAYFVSESLDLEHARDGDAPIEPILVQESGYHCTLRLPQQQCYLHKRETCCTVVVVREHLVSVVCTRAGWGSRRNLMERRWYHFQYAPTAAQPGRWVRRTWLQLPLAERQEVYAAYTSGGFIGGVVPAPGRDPNMPRTSHAVFSKADPLTTYKLVGRDPESGRLFSAFKPSVSYEVGETLHQSARPGHAGGYYSFPESEYGDSVESLLDMFERGELFPKLRHRLEQVAVLRCAAWGRHIEYGAHGGKVATTYLRPLEIVRVIDVAPADEVCESVG